MKTNFAETVAAEAVQMLNYGSPRHKVLAHLVLTAEKIYNDGSVSSILVLDKEGLLRNGRRRDFLTIISPPLTA